MKNRSLVFLATALATLAASSSAAAADAAAADEVAEDPPVKDSIAEFQLELGADATGTEWRGDLVSSGSLKLGFRFIDLVGVYFQGREGYGLVDQRMITQLSLGAQIWGRLGITRPYARLAVLHQHEESLAVIAGDVGSMFIGIGDGIRHRFGAELGVGLHVPFWARKDLSFFGGVDGYAKLMPDDIGPMVQAGGGLNLGLTYAL